MLIKILKAQQAVLSPLNVVINPGQAVCLLEVITDIQPRWTDDELSANPPREISRGGVSEGSTL
jgi:hypothetical protein